MHTTQHTGPVVVGLDGSDASKTALDWAAELASRQGLALRLVHAAWVPPLISPYGTNGHVLQQMTDAALHDGERLLSRATAEIATRFPDLVVTSVLVDRPPVPSLVHESGTASLVVAGATGAGLVEGLLVGSVAIDLPPRSQCPVVVVRGTGSTPAATGRPVVLGVAGSPLDRPSIELAFQQASFRGAPLIAVHAWSDTLLPPIDQLAGIRVAWPEVQQTAQRMLSEQLAGQAARFPDVQVTALVVYDRPTQALLEVAADADLLVVGTRGRGLLAGALLGSVSRAVIQRSLCPVAVVRSEP